MCSRQKGMQIITTYRCVSCKFLLQRHVLYNTIPCITYIKVINIGRLNCDLRTNTLRLCTLKTTTTCHYMKKPVQGYPELRLADSTPCTKFCTMLRETRNKLHSVVVL